MSNESGKVLDRLDPPAGGLAGLRTRMARDAHRRTRIRQGRYAVTVVGVIVIAVAIWFIPHFRPDYYPPEFYQTRIRFGMLPEPTRPVTIDQSQAGTVAARRVPLPSDEVVFYLVGRIEPGEASEVQQ